MTLDRPDIVLMTFIGRSPQNVTTGWSKKTVPQF